MKKSLIISTVILILICFGWFFQNSILHNLYVVADSDLKNVSELIHDEKYVEAYSAFEDYNNKWKRKEDILCLLISHEDIDFITRCNSSLRAYIEVPGQEEALGVIAELYETYRELDTKFRVNFKSIF